MLNITSKLNSQLSFRGQFAVAKIHPLTQTALEQLNDREKAELKLFNNIKRKQEYVSSRLMLKQMAAGIGIAQDEFVILKDEMGCPFGSTNNKQYYVSIAHTDKQIFCGITESTPIGVDLEPIKRKVSDRLKPRIMHSEESDRLAELPAIQLWTIKESFIKLRGKGLRLNMNQVQVQDHQKEFFVEINNDKRAKICSFQNQDHWLALAFYL